MKCTGLMQIPAADGLFPQAIVMRGVADDSILPTAKGDGREIVGTMMKALNFSNVEELETVPYYELARAYNEVSPEIAKHGGYVGNSPMPNDWYMGEPLDVGFTEHAKTIPFIVGSVFGEFSFGPLPLDKGTATQEEIRNVLFSRFGDRTGELISSFQEAYPDKNLLDIFALDRVFRLPSVGLARLAANTGKAPAYVYNFTLEFPYQNGKSAWHCSDIPFFFHNTDIVEICNIPEVSEKLESQIFDAVMAFARTGTPSHPGIPSWPAAKPDDIPTMVFDRKCEVRHNYDDELISLYLDIAGHFSFEALAEDGENIQH